MKPVPKFLAALRSATPAAIEAFEALARLELI
jgi:hypothetical protein